MVLLSARPRLAAASDSLRVDPCRHTASHSLSCQSRFVRLSDVRVLIHIGDRVAPFPRIDGSHVGGIITGRSTATAASSAGPVEDAQTQPFRMRAAML